MLSKTRPVVHVGIDVSKDTLMVSLRPLGECFEIGNTIEGRRSLVMRLKRLRIGRIVLEPSGGYERELLKLLWARKLPAMLVAAEKIRSFARATVGAVKTDPIDAGVLAHYAEVVPLPEPLPRSELAEQLHEHLFLRDFLVQQRTGLRCKAQQVRHPGLRRFIAAELETLKARIAELDATIRAQISQDSQSEALFRRLISAPGIGVLTAISLIADLPELGRIAYRKIVRLVGVAPITRDSGQMRGYRAIGGGRYRLRHKLYMAVLAAIRAGDNDLASFYARLRKAGKLAKVAIVATMNKLLKRLNAMLQAGTNWVSHARVA
jgi:transposase